MSGPKNVFEDLALSAAGVVVATRRLARSQWWPQEQLIAYQMQRVRTLLQGAYERIPYYRDLCWASDVDPYRDLRGLEDLKRLPILDQRTARAQADRLVDPAEAGRALELRTSGTTGDVFRALVSRRHWVMEQATVWRHWSWLGYRFRDRMAILRSYVPESGAPLWRRDRTRNFMYFSAYHLSPENARDYLRQLADWRPRVLRGYPSALALLAEVALEDGFDLPPLKGVLTASETLLPAYRTVIERAFQTRVFDWYGQAECTATLSECAAHAGLHVNAEYGICELVPDDSLPANRRRIVATNLTNTAMPLIRYDTGDVAEVGDDNVACPCGRSLPLVRGVHGRADDYLLTSAGFRVPSVNLYTLMYETAGVRAFQLIQDEPGQLQVVLDVNNWTVGRQSQLELDLCRRLGSEARISFRTDGAFTLSGDGKRPAIVPRAARALARA